MQEGTGGLTDIKGLEFQNCFSWFSFAYLSSQRLASCIWVNGFFKKVSFMLRTVVQPLKESAAPKVCNSYPPVCNYDTLF